MVDGLSLKTVAELRPEKPAVEAEWRDTAVGIHAEVRVSGETRRDVPLIVLNVRVHVEHVVGANRNRDAIEQAVRAAHIRDPLRRERLVRRLVRRDTNLSIGYFAEPLRSHDAAKDAA